MLFSKLGKVYRNCKERYAGLRRKAFIYALAGGLAAISLLLLGCEQKVPEAKRTEGVKTIEIATIGAGALRFQDGKRVDLPGQLLIWRYDGEGGYKPIFEKDGIEFWHEVAAGDVDNDGIDDVVYAHIKGLHFVTYKDGRFVSKEIDSGPFGALRLAIGDMDKKGGDDVLLMDRCTLHYYGFDEEGKSSKSTLAEDDFLYNKVAVGDPDGDGSNEVVTLPVMGDAPVFIGEVVDGELDIEYVIGYDWERRMREEDLPEDSVTRYEVEGFDGEVPALLWYGSKRKACVGGDGGNDILVSGSASDSKRGRFQVLRYNGKGFESLYVSDKFPEEGTACWSCAFGDVTNDGREDVIIGSDRIIVYTYGDRHFTKVWESEPAKSGGSLTGIHSVCVADTDGDGLNEVWASFKDKTPPGSGARLKVYGNRGRGETEIFKEWESERFDDVGWFCIAASDFDGK